MLKRLEAVRDGKVAAASLMEPWISVAQKWGLRILIESHSTRSEAAGDDLDGQTLSEDVPGAGARGARCSRRTRRPTSTISSRETGGLLEPHEFQTWRLLHAAAAALHARALRRHLQLDGEVEHDGAGRHLREHRRQPGLAVAAARRTDRAGWSLLRAAARYFA